MTDNNHVKETQLESAEEAAVKATVDSEKTETEKIENKAEDKDKKEVIEPETSKNEPAEEAAPDSKASENQSEAGWYRKGAFNQGQCKHRHEQCSQLGGDRTRKNAGGT